jgi:predicted O-methyltransferase YrrM
MLTALSKCFQNKQFSADWTSHNFPNWMTVLAPLQNRAAHVLEIGSWEGRSAIFWLEYLPRCRLVCIDSFDGGTTGPTLPELRSQAALTEGRFDANLAPYAGRFEKVVSRSVPALDRLNARKSEFDLIYVDGGHLRDEVLVDSLLCWPMLRPGGILIWDDYAWHPELPSRQRPQEAIDTFLRLQTGSFTELHRSYQVIVEKISHHPQGEAEKQVNHVPASG